jgi:hypothetical protein
MADNPGEPHLLAAFSKLAPYAPGVAGAIAGMAYGERLKPQGKALTLAIGLLSAWLGGPVIFDIGRAVAPAFFPSSMAPLLGFMAGFFGMAMFGGLYQAVAKYAGDPLKIIKFEAGGLKVGGGDTAEGG